MSTTTGSITGAGQTVSLTNIRDSLISVVIIGPTYAGVELIFEASLNGSDFFPVGLESLENGLIQPTTGLISDDNLVFLRAVATRDTDTFRVRSLAHSSGTANITIKSTKVITEPASLEQIVHGQTQVATAGVAVILLSASQDTGTVTIAAKETNVGNVFVGKSGVTSSNGYILPQGASISIDHNHKKDNIYINASNNGDGVSYIASIIVE